MVVATGVNDTLELASPRRRGSSSSDVVPEDDGIEQSGIEQSAAGATAERPMEDSTRAQPPTRTDSGSALKRLVKRASSTLLSLKSSSSRDVFFSKNTGPSWLRKLSAARRSTENIDEQSVSSKSAKGVPRDALDRADAATSFRPLPREVLDAVRKSTSASGQPGGIINYSGRLDAARECLASSHEAS